MKPFVFFFFACFPATSIFAQQGLIPPEEQPRWDAVGRIHNGGYVPDSICSAALIAPDLVLTAAHCVGNMRHASTERLHNLFFVAGWNKDRHAGAGRAIAVTFDPDHDFAELSVDNIPTDVAVITLEKPLDVPPLPLGRITDDSGDLDIVAYSNNLRYAPRRLTGCTPERQGGRLFVMDCNVISGNSGAPVIAVSGDMMELVGVVSARTPDRAWAAELPAWIRSLVIARTLK